MSNFTKFETYQWTAKKNGKTFELTKSQVEQICAQPCTFCGAKAHDLDRKDNDEGYDLVNCIPACKFCKAAKSKGSTPDVWNWIDRVVAHRMKINPSHRIVKSTADCDESIADEDLLAHEEADEAN